MPALQNKCFHPAHKQRGAALMLLLLLVGVGALAVFVSGLNRATSQLERDRITMAALAQAKEALIGWAAGNTRRGYLPCPADPLLAGTLNEGNARISCNTDASRIGRLPWRTLKLGDLRDGYGEPLWYAVSANFTDDALVINSDTGIATLSVNGALNFSAIIFSPGSALNSQLRDGTLKPCGATGTTIRRDYCADNYLDVDVVTGISNRDADASFVLAANSSLTPRNDDQFNDQLVSVAADEFFSVMERRVVGQVKSCLYQYANDPANPAHLYPWADKVDPTDTTNSGDYNDDVGVRTGRVADYLSTSVPAAWSGNSCPLYCASTPCPVGHKNWLLDWRELVFYAVSDKYSPAGTGDGSPGGALMTVGSNPNIRAVVFLARKKLPAQNRVSAADKITRSNYLEDENANGNFVVGDDTYIDLPVSTTYNDKVLIVAP